MIGEREIFLDERYDDDSSGEDGSPLRVRKTTPALDLGCINLENIAPRPEYVPTSPPRIPTTPELGGVWPPRFATREEILCSLDSPLVLQRKGLLIPFLNLEEIISGPTKALEYRHAMYKRRRGLKKKRSRAPAEDPVHASGEDALLTDSDDDDGAHYAWQHPDYRCPFASSSMPDLGRGGRMRPKIRRAHSAPACGSLLESDDLPAYELLEPPGPQRGGLEFAWRNGKFVPRERPVDSDTECGDGEAGCFVANSISGLMTWSLRDVKELPNTQTLDFNNKHLMVSLDDEDDGSDEDDSPMHGLMAETSCIFLRKKDYSRLLVGKNKHRYRRSTEASGAGVQAGADYAVNRRCMSAFAKDMLLQLNVPSDVLEGCAVNKTKNQRWGPECLISHLLIAYKKSVNGGTAVVPPREQRIRKARGSRNDSHEPNDDDDASSNSSDDRFVEELIKCMKSAGERGVAGVPAHKSDMPDVLDLAADTGARLDAIEHHK